MINAEGSWILKKQAVDIITKQISQADYSRMLRFANQMYGLSRKNTSIDDLLDQHHLGLDLLQEVLLKLRIIDTLKQNHKSKIHSSLDIF